VKISNFTSVVAKGCEKFLGASKKFKRLLVRADESLYKVKQTGGNSVIMAK